MKVYSICSGEGRILPEEQAANNRYFYELASATFGWDIEFKKVQAFHLKMDKQKPVVNFQEKNRW